MKKISLRAPWLLLFFCLAIVPVNAQQRKQTAWWYALEQGKRSFREGAYGDALLFFEDARRQRYAMYERMKNDLIDFLSLPQVRRLGDSLDRSESFARERRYDNAVEALDEAYYRFSKDSFSDSAKTVLDALDKLKKYPEAEYWIGETYRMEGELTLAVSQYQKAWEQRSLLEQKGFETELLYKIAGVRKIRQEYNEMERTLLQILEQDNLWSVRDAAEISVSTSENEAINSFARSAMIRTLETNGIDRFLVLYRYINKPVEQAHRLLGLYYYASGRHSKAQEHLMFSFLIQSSAIIEEVIRNESDWTFSSLSALAQIMGQYPLITEYINSTDYYKTAYYLGCSLYGNGKTSAARSLWSFLAGLSSAGEWQNRARLQLRQPQLERIVEMP